MDPTPGDEAEQLTAHALDWLATAVPAAVAIATPVDRPLHQTRPPL
jgi:hypothetical protein